MSPQLETDVYAVAKVLNEQLENYYLDSLSADELAEKTGLDSKRLAKAIDRLVAGQWAEKTREYQNGYYVRLTLDGKVQFDTKTQNTINTQVRDKILEAVATFDEAHPNHFADSDTLANELGLGWNTVCFNLTVMEAQGLVELSGGMGGGHPYYTVRITSKGRTLHDNPPSQLLFLSHAAVEGAIAARMREILGQTFQNMTVFVSSAPDALAPGDPWVDKILSALREARAALILSTEAALSRPWIWFEAGAAWGKEIPLLCCCVGSQRKSRLPSPFALYQAVDLDDERDLRALFLKLEQVFGPATMPDFAALATEFQTIQSSSLS